MSRDYIDDPSEDAAFTLRSIRDDVSRIADTLDDYMDLTLAAQEIAAQMQLQSAHAPEVMAVLQPVIDALASVRERRSAR